MKKIKSSIVKSVVVLGLLSTPIIFNSCRQELDINTDPNNPPNASVQSLLSASQAGFAYALGGEGTRMPAAFMQHYAGHRGQPLDHARYRVRTSDTDNTWESFYNVLMDMKELEKKATASGDQVYLGMSKILQAHAFSVLTDLFGDIPFTEALQGKANLSPAYDKQETIYPALIKMIEEGITDVKSGAGVSPAGADIVYNGDVTKWEKYANSLKLRLLNHQSKKTPLAAATFLATNPALIENFADNAKVNFGSTAANANPIYQFDVLSGRKDQAVASTIVDKMKSLSDPRVTVYFAPVKNDGAGKKGQYLGNAPGSNVDDSGENNYSRVGSAYAGSTAPVVLMTAAEVNFIKAEVYKRAGNDASAKTAYDTAITQDFLALGLSSASTYLANSSVAYNNTMERIMEQKWITMFQASYESWIDWRRTGFPALTPPANNSSFTKAIPRRLPYPTVELNVNRNNLIAVVGGNIVEFQFYLKPVWWDE